MQRKPYAASGRWPANEAISPQVLEVCRCILPRRAEAGRISYPCWVLDYEYHSSTYCRVEGYPWRLRQGRTVHLYPPGTVYWEKPRPEVEWTHSAWFLFTGRLEEFLGRFVGREGYAVFDDPNRLVGRELRRAAQAARKWGRAAYWFVHAALANCLGYLATARHVQEQRWILSSSDVPAADPPDFDLIAEADRYLREHLAERITLDTLAERLGVSRSTLSHLFRRRTGETPMARLRHRRIEASKILIRRGFPLRHVAEQTGFCDEYHLARTFRRMVGRTPGQFRREEFSSTFPSPKTPPAGGKSG